MSLRVLIVDDDPDIVDLASATMRSLHHQYRVAGDQESAEKLLATEPFDIVLLDLQIPVAPDDFSSIENGLHVLMHIRTDPRLYELPVIVMTGHGNDGPHLCSRAMKLGAIDYLPKPFTDAALAKAIFEAQARVGKGCGVAFPGGVAVQSTLRPPQAPEVFSAKPREMVIYEDRVTICGIEVWRETGQSQMRELLLLLNQKEGEHYVRMRGPELLKALGRRESNLLGRPIKDFRDTAAARLLQERQLVCGKNDIIATARGYHYPAWIDLKVDGTAPATNTTAIPTPAEPEEKAPSELLTQEQKWILEQLQQGHKLRLPDILRHNQKSRSVINRRLKQLRELGMIATHDDGYYILQQPVAQGATR